MPIEGAPSPANINGRVERRERLGGLLWGHATEQMQQHYSTVAQTEMREGIAKIISLAGVREAMGAKGYVLAL